MPRMERQLSQHLTSPVSYPGCSQLEIHVCARRSISAPIELGLEEPFYRKKSMLPGEQYGCQTPVEWEVTITVHHTVITDLSLLSLTIYSTFLLEGVRFQTALLITWHTHRTISVWKLLYHFICGSTAYFLNVSCSLSFWRFAFMSSWTALHLKELFFFFFFSFSRLHRSSSTQRRYTRLRCVSNNHHWHYCNRRCICERCESLRL